MRARAGLACLCLAMGLGGPHAARADGAQALFEEAERMDLRGGGPGGASSAFALYKRAAEAGLPQAEFNVAVMLDSGRGTPPDAKQAAAWYARAALHGDRRAAFNLGQLYALGQGVPKNDDLARAWLSASDLPAARARLARRAAAAPAEAALSAPEPVAPAGGQDVGPGDGGLELVWVSQAQPGHVRFFVELRTVDPGGSREVFSGFCDTSGMLVDPSLNLAGGYAWRVLAVSGRSGRYAASGWTLFSASQTAARAGPSPGADGVQAR